jgi:hypothetical protein
MVDSGGGNDHEPLSNREWMWIAVECTVAIAVWVFAVGFLLDLRELTDYVVEFGGAMLIALAIGWWRALRFGEGGPPRDGSGVRRTWGSRFNLAPAGAFYLWWSVFAAALCGGSLAQDKTQVRIASLGFAVLAVRFFILYLRHRSD